MNQKEVFQETEFTLKEKVDFFKKKWNREHRWENIGIVLTVAILMGVGLIYDNGLHLIGLAVAVVLPIIQRNRMMAYVEQRAFDGSGRQ